MEAAMTKLIARRTVLPSSLVQFVPNNKTRVVDILAGLGPHSSRVFSRATLEGVTAAPNVEVAQYRWG